MRALELVDPAVELRERVNAWYHKRVRDPSKREEFYNCLMAFDAAELPRLWGVILYYGRNLTRATAHRKALALVQHWPYLSGCVPLPRPTATRQNRRLGLHDL